ncbi:MAG: hypothetical protein C4562_02965 [Actinobacteria bacterium]|nr:MAG: hypothetical protein C4562_02965 [Actinomycetota bacterium]
MDFSGLKQRIVDWYIKSDFNITKSQAIAIVGVVLIILTITLYLSFRPQKEIEVKDNSTVVASRQEEEAIVVYVTGQVRRPSVYNLKDGSRIVDAVKAAGGFNKYADKESLNLAQKVSDGEKILVPKKGKTGNQSGQSANGKININTASEKELEELPGVGPTLAERIVDYRKQQGSIKSIDELSQIEGIGPKKFSKIKEEASLN